MRPTSFALLLLTLLATTARAEQPVEPLAETPRPLLPERSEQQAETLRQRLDGREQQMLQTADETFLSLWLPANVATPSGSVIFLPGDALSADDPALAGPLRRRLPDAGWNSLSLTLPDPDGDSLPLRTSSSTAATPPVQKDEDTGEDDSTSLAEEPDETEPATNQSAANSHTSTPEQRRQAHTERVMARLDAAVAFTRQQGTEPIVLLGQGSGAYWAVAYLERNKSDDLGHLLLVDAQVPAGFEPVLEERLAQLAVATGDFHDSSRPASSKAALARLQASRRAGQQHYTQVALAASANPQVQQEQLFRRLRGWLQQHAQPATAGIEP